MDLTDLHWRSPVGLGIFFTGLAVLTRTNVIEYSGVAEE